MIEFDIPFVNYDGERVTEKFHFHLHMSELAELNAAYPDGFKEHFEKVMAKKDGATILEEFKSLMLRTVGRREGRLFIKNQEVRDDFEFSGAYSAMFVMMQLGQIDAVQFMNGVMPKDLHEKAAEAEARRKVLEAAGQNPERKKAGDYTLPELLDLPDDEFAALKQESRHNAPQNLIVASFQRDNR